MIPFRFSVIRSTQSFWRPIQWRTTHRWVSWARARSEKCPSQKNRYGDIAELVNVNADVPSSYVKHFLGHEIFRIWQDCWEKEYYSKTFCNVFPKVSEGCAYVPPLTNRAFTGHGLSRPTTAVLGSSVWFVRAHFAHPRNQLLANIYWSSAW